MSDVQEFKARFDNKILGIRNYGSAKKEFDSDDFLDLEVLVDFLWEVDTGESDMTPAGKYFIENYYGFDELVKELVTQGYNLPPDNEESNQQATSEWLRSISPMQTITFIEQSRGNIHEDATFREDLLPPKPQA